MGSDDTSNSLPATLRDVPWRWSDLAVGFAPIILGFNSYRLIGPATAASIPRWFWIPTEVLGFAWMSAFPLWVARRRSVCLRFPRLGSIGRESLVALLALMAIWAIAAAVSLATRSVRWDGAPGPYEAIATSPERYHFVALAVMAVLAAPFAEEVIFRGMLYNALRRRMHFLLAATFQGVAFGLLHPFGLADRAGVALTGFCLAMLYEWRKTLAASISLHALANALGIAAMLPSVALAANAPVLGVVGYANGQGCVVTELLQGGAAEAAGIRIGDVIVAAGENSVADFGELVRIMRSKKVGDRIPVWFTRGGEQFQVEAVLKSRSASGPPK